MRCHRPGPKASGARFADDDQFSQRRVFHGASTRTDVAGAARANHNYSDVVQRHRGTFKDLKKFNVQGQNSTNSSCSKPFQPFQSFHAERRSFSLEVPKVRDIDQCTVRISETFGTIGTAGTLPFIWQTGRACFFQSRRGSLRQIVSGSQSLHA